MPTKLLISDSNVLIDCDCSGLLDAMFELPFEFAVPSVLYVEELRENHSDLPEKGLQVLEFGEAISLDIVALRSRHPKPGFNDLTALALARALGAPLLTGDAHLRRAAKAENCAHKGTIWLLEQLVREQIITRRAALAALDAMQDNGRRLPWKAARKKFEELI